MSSDTKLSEILKVRVTKNIYEKIEHKAKRADMSISEYLRFVLYLFH